MKKQIVIDGNRYTVEAHSVEKPTTDRYYIKPVGGGYYAVMDGYDKSMSSLECSKEAAEKCVKELEELN